MIFHVNQQIEYVFWFIFRVTIKHRKTINLPEYVLLIFLLKHNESKICYCPLKWSDGFNLIFDFNGNFFKTKERYCDLPYNGITI
jgi:hypothetical protein